ncbi:hypothetical protein DM02DRAFT_671848 [Periconia macrospinosa]|uniref:ZZ-type domain-containing protein n=1 Tax=Periconia macrospinosa TaxID=97972 RepID=A0A2V1DR27_9PLEO|nr:hypothetical protein DM02DRAFT_671848 [Periconia macrospinosa]
MSIQNVSQRVDSTDLGVLWTKAVDDYMQKTGNNVAPMRSQSLNDVMEATSKEMKAFGGRRHDGGKVDKVRSAFQRHLAGMQKCMNGLEMVGAAAGAFPPAMPVGIVFSACGRLLSAFAAASAQYDKVEEFFTHAGRFFERLSLLEGKASGEPLALAIVRVFSIQLSICGIAQRLATSGRVKLFFNMLWNMEDPELSAAYAAMQASIEELGATIGYASYSAIRDTHEDVSKVNEKLDELDAHIQGFRSTLTQDVQALYASNIALDIKITKGFVSMEAKQDQSYELQLYLAQTQDQIMKAIAQSATPPEGIQTKGDVGDASIKAAAHVRSFFEDRQEQYPAFSTVYDNNLEQHEYLEKTMVSYTNEWLFADPTFSKWRNAVSQVIWLQGIDGTGKTYLTCAAHQDAISQLGDSVCCGYFYFFPDRACVETALACIVMQIVARNERYAEAMAAQLREEAASPGLVPADTSTWKRFFTSRFTTANGSDRLLLFLDGFDEAREDQKQLMIDFVEYIEANKSRISIFLTTRRTFVPKFGSLSSEIIHITKERVTPNLTFLIKKRLETRPQLRRLSKVARKTILRNLLKHADSMLFADHMLQRLSYIGRESVIIRALDNMPSSLVELFELFERECAKGRSEEQLTVLRALFTWMTYAEKTLTLSDASILIAYTVQASRGRSFQEQIQAMNGASLLHNDNEVIDIEDEIVARSSRFLRMSRQPTSSESRTDDIETSDEEDDDAEAIDEMNDPTMIAYRTTELVFQDYATRRFFRHPERVNNASETGLRVSALQANLDIFVACVDLILGLGWTKSSRSMKPNSLQEYALSFWQRHFSQLDVAQADDATAIRVVQTLYRISLNAEMFATAVQRHCLDLDSVLPERAPASTSWYDQVKLWADRAAGLGVDATSEDLRQWIRGPKEELILLPLARGHLKAWFFETSQWGFVYGYQLGRRCIQLTQRNELIYQGSDNIQEISHYAGIFPSSIPDSLKLKAITVTYFALHFKLDGSTTGGNVDFVIGQMQESAALATTSRDRMITLYFLGIFYCMLNKKADAISVFSKARREISRENLDLTSSEGEDIVSSEVANIRELILDRLSDLLEGTGRYQEALDLRSEFKSLYNILRYNINFSIIRLCWKLDQTGQKAMDILKSWSKKERNTYFRRIYGGPVSRADLIEHTRPPRRTAEMQLYLGWLQEADQTLYQQQVRATIYQDILHDVEKAKEVRLQLFRAKPALYDIKKRVDDIKLVQGEEWRRHAAAIYRQFLATSNPEIMESKLEELASLPVLRFQQSDELQESQVGMLRAYMLRVLGPTREYQKSMNTLFNICVAGLEDGVSYNDGPSLRLLTKVLSSLPGLERDACISYAAQFSILDRQLQHSSNNGNLNKTSSHEEHTFWNGDEDLTKIEYPCDGCGRKQFRWDSAQYMCLVCPNLDLCEACYEKENESHHRAPQASNPDENGVWEDELWHPFCDNTHVYIKGPMKHWKGVRGGMIRIDDSEVAVRDWLKGLKEVRWKQAWDFFWRSQNRLCNIGPEAF